MQRNYTMKNAKEQRFHQKPNFEQRLQIRCEAEHQIGRSRAGRPKLEGLSNVFEGRRRLERKKVSRKKEREGKKN